MGHTYNHGYLAGWDRRIVNLKPAWAKQWDPHLKKKKKDKTSKKERIKDDKGREESKEKSNKNFTKLKKSNTFIEKPIKYLRNEEIKWSNPRYDKGVSSLRG
jgi:hypothetical protein